MLQYRDLLSSIPVLTVNEHDVMLQSLQRKYENSTGWRHRLLRLEYGRMKRWELQALSDMSFVTVQNPKDKALLESHSLSRPVLCMRPWIESVSAAESNTHWKKEAYSLVFFGAMNRTENVDAAVYASKEIFPLITAAVPEAKYYVGGSNPPPTVLSLGSDSVTVSGFVDDLTEYLGTKEIGFFPLRLGAGIKVKVLECMAVGTPVVTTPVGIEGIDVQNERHVIVRNTAKELAEAVTRLLRNPERRLQIAAEARKWFVDHYSFDRPMQELEQFVEERIARTSKQYQRAR
jgi:glycosyltransferase involved in cell wall biosynthesis